MIHVLKLHTRTDPAEILRVHRIAGAKLNHRSCTVIRVVHPAKQDGLQFHEANVFVDDQLHVPVRVDFSDWPARYRDPSPRLIAEYTYTNLQLNVDLADIAFDPARLRDK